MAIAILCLIAFVGLGLIAAWVSESNTIRQGDYVQFHYDFEYGFTTYKVEGKAGYVTKITKNGVGWEVYHVETTDGTYAKFHWAHQGNVSKQLDPRKKKKRKWF